MGKTGINLLNTKKDASSKNRLLGSLKKGSVIFLIIYIGLAVGVLSVYTIINKRASEIRDNITNAENKIKTLQKTESLEISLKDRINVISQITDNTIDANEIVNKIDSAISMIDVVLGDMTINEKGISISASAENEATLRSFLQSLKEQGNVFSRIEVGPFSRDKAGKYSFSLSIIN